MPSSALGFLVSKIDDRDYAHASCQCTHTIKTKRLRTIQTTSVNVRVHAIKTKRHQNVRTIQTASVNARTPSKQNVYVRFCVLARVVLRSETLCCVCDMHTHTGGT